LSLGKMLGTTIAFSICGSSVHASTPPSKAAADLPPGTHCYDLNRLRPAIEQFAKRRPQVGEACSALTTQYQCNSEENQIKGCAWCSGSCKSVKAVHQAFIACVRSAYAEHQPDRVNGKPVPGIVSMSTQKSAFRGSAGPPTLSPLVSDDLRSGYRWDISEVSRKKGERVPIHMHPYGGLIKVLEGEDISVFVEGEEPLVGLKAGDFYSMPANRKIGTHSGCSKGYKDLDIFKLNICYPAWVVLEPAGYSIQDRQFSIDDDGKQQGHHH